ncbi:putative carboxylesterase, type B, carboxylesterase type B, active, alpha/Beta hydrolase [Septoria linicola]|nr:putative carboxylesterase, type B, carboxylesterase type B, active, alpha/Beta hydrolase [Septoria linicola]
MKNIAVALLSLCAPIHASSCAPTATTANATYAGLYKDQVEAFLGIQYGQDTGGVNRFKPPVPHSASGALEAVHPGPACPQALGPNTLPLYLGNITAISEDCLILNVFRPNGTTEHDRLPVMVYIHGGGFKSASKDDPVSQPGGMILKSIENGHPVISVQINYRLGIFGFAQSAALHLEGSENAGLRDQRLAIEWVHKEICNFGGDPDNVLIHGQSSGGLAVGMQMLAYGGEEPQVFHKAIGQSQILEGGITGNFTRDAMQDVADYTKCNSTSLDSATTLICLRALSTDELFAAQNATATDLNVGDIWLPVVDGDFLPAAPSDLISSRRFYNVTTMIGWCEDDTTFFVPPTVTNASATRAYFEDYLPGFTTSNLDKLLDLYPSSDFNPAYFSNGTIALPGEIGRAGRILRDILMTCQPVYFGETTCTSTTRIKLSSHPS